MGMCKVCNKVKSALYMIDGICKECMGDEEFEKRKNIKPINEKFTNKKQNKKLYTNEDKLVYIHKKEWNHYRIYLILFIISIFSIMLYFGNKALSIGGFILILSSIVIYFIAYYDFKKKVKNTYFKLIYSNSEEMLNKAFSQTKREDRKFDKFLESLFMTAIIVVCLVYAIYGYIKEEYTIKEVTTGIVNSTKLKNNTKELYNILYKLDYYNNKKPNSTIYKTISYKKGEVLINIYLKSKVMTEKEYELYLINLERDGGIDAIKDSFIKKIESNNNILFNLKNNVHIKITISDVAVKTDKDNNDINKKHRRELHTFYVRYSDVQEYWDKYKKKQR